MTTTSTPMAKRTSISRVQRIDTAIHESGGQDKTHTWVNRRPICETALKVGPGETLRHGPRRLYRGIILR
jgi:hypothetical protein